MCCHTPGKSMNFMSTISALRSLANVRTSFGVIELIGWLPFLRNRNCEFSCAGSARQRRSDGALAALAGADTDRFFHVRDEDLSVTDPARAGGLFDGGD